MSSCIVCGSRRLSDILEIREVPVHCNVQWASREEALAAPRGAIDLVFCNDCGHLFNARFDASLTAYSEQYENSLHFSPRFNGYARRLAQRLVRKYRLSGKHVIEIGCGKGDFLAMLCHGGMNRGLGFDRSFQAGRLGASESQSIRFVADDYDRRYAEEPVDLIVCRHVLEHVSSPVEFLASIRRTVESRDACPMYLEVPNALYTLRDLGIWDLIYEHCSYFTPRSLRRALVESGFAIEAIRPEFGDQFLGAEALASGPEGAPDPAEATIDRLQAWAALFRDQHRRKIGAWQRRLKEGARARTKTVVWGAGSKGVTFLNTVDADRTIEYVVDANPHKQGRYVSVSGQRIVGPDVLAAYRPERVVAMNPMYLGEIQEVLRAVGVEAELLAA